MISTDKITEIFCFIDEFHQEFEQAQNGHLLQADCGIKRRNRKSRLSNSEVMTLMVLFHFGNFRNLKHFYLFYVKPHLKSEFPETVSYNRFVELQQKAVVPMALFLKMCCLGKCTGISFIDSTPLRSCHIKREKQHKTFKGMAAKGH